MTFLGTASIVAGYVGLVLINGWLGLAVGLVHVGAMALAAALK